MQPNCGGRKPTNDEYSRPTKIGCCCCYLLFFLIVIVIGLIGFLSTNQMAADVQDVIKALDSVNAFSDIYKGQIGADLEVVKTYSKESMAGINDNLVGIAKLLDDSYASYNASLNVLLASVVGVRRFVEGTLAEQPNPCDFSMNTTKVEYTAAGWKAIGTNLPTGSNVCCADEYSQSCIKGSHRVGLGTSMTGENSRGAACKRYTVSGPNVSSTAAECGCCCACIELEYKLRMSMSMIPHKGDASVLEKPVDTEAVGVIIVKARDSLDSSVTEFSKAFASISAVTSIASSSLGNQGAVIGVAVSIWAFAWLTAFLGLIGWLLKKHCCWWTAYTMAIICLLMFFILWGASSAIVMPFGDLCDGMPRTGESPMNWLMTFSPTNSLSGVSPLLVSLYTSCLARRGGYLWGVAGINRTNIMTRFNAFDVAQTLPTSIRTRLLDAAAISAPFTETKGLIATFGSTQSIALTPLVNRSALQSANSTQGSAVLADLDLYQATLSRTIARMQADATANSAQQDLLMVATHLVSLNLTRMTNTSSSTIYGITDRIMRSGSCDELNSMYENVRMPLCDKLSKSLDAVWCLFFLMAIVWFPIFILICANSKHSQHARGEKIKLPHASTLLYRGPPPFFFLLFRPRVLCEKHRIFCVSLPRSVTKKRTRHQVFRPWRMRNIPWATRRRRERARKRRIRAEAGVGVEGVGAKWRRRKRRRKRRKM